MKIQHALALFAFCSPALAQATVYEFDGLAGDEYAGRAVAGVGDVDGDGWDDVAVGIPLPNLIGVLGRVEVYSGLTGQLIRTWSGQNAGDEFGSAVAGVGDLNGDGLADLLIGAPFHDEGPLQDAGRVYLVSGAGPVLAAHGGTQGSALLGYSVAGVGDVNADGIPDYACGAPLQGLAVPGTGYFEVRSGATFAVLFSVSGFASQDQMGRAIAGIGDVDGDGRDDVAVGAPGYDNNLQFKLDVGRVYVYGYKSGSAQLLSSSLGSWANGKFGWSVAGVGDIDGDLVPDFAAGAPFATPNLGYSGEVRVISGKTQQILHTFQGGSFDMAGYAVAGVGDMNGDGVGEIAVGSPKHDAPGLNVAGMVQAYSGATGSILHTWEGTKTYGQLGFAVAGAGDLNHDGRADAAFGAPTFDIGGALNVGRVMVVLAEAPIPSTYCTAKVSSAGCTPQIAASGAASLSIADNFHITASKILYSVPGVLIWSQAPGSTPFGGGTLCLGGQVTRTPGQFAGGIFGLPCSGSFDFFFSQAYMASMGLVAGTTLYAQFWSRDQGFAAPNNMNLTDAVWFPVLP